MAILRLPKSCPALTFRSPAVALSSSSRGSDSKLPRDSMPVSATSRPCLVASESMPFCTSSSDSYSTSSLKRNEMSGSASRRVFMRSFTRGTSLITYSLSGIVPKLSGGHSVQKDRRASASASSVSVRM